MYEVVRYPGDGHGWSERLVARVASLAAAREVVRRELGVKRLHPVRRWDGEPGDIEAYHELTPRHYVDRGLRPDWGCGGYAIRRV